MTVTHQTISKQRRNSLDFAVWVIDRGSDWKYERLLAEMGTRREEGGKEAAVEIRSISFHPDTIGQLDTTCWYKIWFKYPFLVLLILCRQMICVVELYILCHNVPHELCCWTLHLEENQSIYDFKHYNGRRWSPKVIHYIPSMLWHTHVWHTVSLNSQMLEY